MKKEFYFIIAALLLLFSCQSEPARTVDVKSAAAENIDHTKTLVVPWIVAINDSTNMMEIKKDPASDMTNLGPEDIVDALNLKYPKIKLLWVKQTGSKVFVKINDPSYLTQQSGSGGAQAYLAEVTYSLTELKGIVAVNFTFKEGDHAQPGTYTREDFANLN